MSKKKGPRILITLECSECRTNKIKRRKGVSCYLTSKNRRTCLKKLELKKFCRFCNLHTLHKEIK